MSNQSNEKCVQDDNYIFGSKLGKIFNTTPQIFILRSMMGSLAGLVLADIGMVIYAFFFSKWDLWLKILSSISGIFGACLMIGILIMTFQQYKTYLQISNLQKDLVQVLNQTGGIQNG